LGEVQGEKQNLSGYINGREKKFSFAGFYIAEHSFCGAKRAKWV
jgi:hypothetical protein